MNLQPLIGRLQTTAPRLTERVRLLRPGSRQRRDRLRDLTRAEIFAEIHERNEWDDSESVSGGGSTLQATRSLRTELPNILRRYSVRSMVDVPCGDFNWMSKVDLAGVRYMGIDIVQSIVDSLNDRYGTDEVAFAMADVVDDELPDADAVLCRDLLLHLPLEDAAKVVRRLSNKYRLRLISTNPDVRVNTDIVTGETRHLNLVLPPFNLPPPTMTIADPTDRFPNRLIGVWEQQ